MSRAEVLGRLAGFPSELRAAAFGADQRPVADGEWGPNEVVRHLIACEIEVHRARLADLDTSSSPTWDWAEPGPWPDEPELTLAELLERFDAQRAVTLATAAGLDEAGWARTGTHTTLGVFDVEALLRNAADHDTEHLRGLT